MGQAVFLEQPCEHGFCADHSGGIQ
jgi:hypothetical protein